MESLSISCSSLRLPTIVRRRCKAFSHDNRLISTKPPTEDIKIYDKLTLQGLHGETRFSKFITNNQRKRDFVRACAQVESAGSDPVLIKAEEESLEPDSVLDQILQFGYTWYNFSRPVAMLQVIIASSSLFARVLIENPQSFKFSLLFKAFSGLIAMLLGNAYYNGINQIYDVEIDRVNKPYLPIAAGELSVKQAWFLMICYVLTGISILLIMNADLITTSLYCICLLLATFYSAPPFRFKGSRIASSIVIPLNAGILQTVGLLYTTRASLGLPFGWSPPIVFITTFLALFYLVISIVKDIIDVEGDMKYNIKTFAAILGPKNTIFLGTGILLVNYIGAIATAIYMPQAFKSYIMLPVHSIFAMWLVFQARMVHKENYTKRASAKFYATVWKLLASEFLLFPFI